MAPKPLDGTTALDALVKAGDLASYDRYRGMSGDDLLYLVLPSGRELHIAASILEGQFSNGQASILRVNVPVREPSKTT